MNTTAKKGKQQSAKGTNKKEGFTAEEKAAMRARARELKDTADGESAVRAAIAARTAFSPSVSFSAAFAAAFSSAVNFRAIRLLSCVRLPGRTGRAAAARC